MIGRLLRVLAVRLNVLELIDGKAAIESIEAHARDIFDLVE